MPIEEELYKLLDLILKDEFIKTSQKSISLVTAFRLEYEITEEEGEIAPEDAVKSKYQQAAERCKGKCKKGCTKRCTSFKKTKGCRRTCECNGICGNIFNLK
jgi:hypothetical protein